MNNEEILKQIKGRLIVSCQALPGEALVSPYIMQRMAVAAQMGGACGIRANGVDNILEIRKEVKLPMIGIIKREYDGCPVYITPTMREVDELAACGLEIIAVDATNRLRPFGESLDACFGQVRAKYPGQLFMADCATAEEALHAASIGFDLLGTTLCGYTDDTRGTELPNVGMVRALREKTGLPIVAEGGIWAPPQLRSVMEAGAFCAVIGTAITRPQQITEYFIRALS